MSFTPSLGNLNALMASLNQVAANSIFNFTNTPTSESWTTMHGLIAQWISTNTFNANGLRVLVALADGTVCYDSAKGDDLNKFSNFNTKSINENHNTRVAILQALLSNNGVGFETKLSTTTNVVTNYLAQRIWVTNGRPMGTIRVSVDFQ
jgi:hypothetical protein